jgi:hypothetical protein
MSLEPWYKVVTPREDMREEERAVDDVLARKKGLGF